MEICRDGEWAFDLLRPADDWRDAAESGRVESGQARGSCLAPWLVNDDVPLFVRGLPPRNGDLVIVEMPYARGLVLGAGQQVRWEPSMKQLQIADGRRWLTCADGAVELDEQHVCSINGQRFSLKITAVIVAVVRRTRRALPPMAEMSFPVAEPPPLLPHG